MHEILLQASILNKWKLSRCSGLEEDKSKHRRIVLYNCGSNFIFRRASNETQNITFASIHGNDGRLPEDQKSIWQSLSNFAYKKIYTVRKKIISALIEFSPEISVPQISEFCRYLNLKSII